MNDKGGGKTEGEDKIVAFLRKKGEREVRKKGRRSKNNGCGKRR